ncbi:MAG: hypothetical protein HXY51_07675 [Nitrospirae bacterium]|nr:hypothetical protein [Nitrospirota bacterium]
MNVKHKQVTRKYPQSWGNLAVDNQSFGATQGTKARTSSLAPVTVWDIPGGESEVDSLGPAKGIILGFGLSIMLWSVIILVMSWIL